MQQTAPERERKVGSVPRGAARVHHSQSLLAVQLCEFRQLHDRHLRQVRPSEYIGS